MKLKPVKLHLGNFGYLLILLVGLFFLHGYFYGAAEQNFYIPVIKRILDQNYLNNDWFISRMDYHKNVLILIAWLSRAVTLQGAVFVFYLLSAQLYLSGAFLLAKAVTKSRTVSVVFSFMAAVVFSFGLGGYLLFTNYFIPGLLGAALLLYCLYFFFEDKHEAALLVVLLIMKLHLLLGVSVFLLIAPWYLFYGAEYWRSRTKNLFAVLAGFLFFCGKDIYSAVSAVSLQRGSWFLDVNCRIRYPQHYLLLNNEQIILSCWALMLLATVYLSGKLLPKFSARKINYLLFVLGGFCFINLVFVDLFPLKFIAQLQLLRSTYLVEFLFMLLLCQAAVRDKRIAVFLIVGLGFLKCFFPELGLRYIFWFFVLALVLAVDKFKNQEIKIREWALAGFLLIVVLANFMINKPELMQNSKERAWNECCFWIRNNTPKEAVFIISPEQESFRFKAQRAIVVDYKYCPYKETEIKEWKERMELSINKPLSLLNNKGLKSETEIGRAFQGLSVQNIGRIKEKYAAEYLVTKAVFSQYLRIYSNKEWHIYHL